MWPGNLDGFPRFRRALLGLVISKDFGRLRISYGLVKGNSWDVGGGQPEGGMWAG